MKNQVVLDWNQYVALARQTVAEGCVLLENKDQALPLVKDEKVAVFGRIQNHYYKSGTGSGGMVNVSKVYGIVDGLRESGQVILDEELIKIYQDWEETHPFNEGEGWGNEPWCQEEMELTDEVVEAAGKRSETAIVIIGRTAGEYISRCKSVHYFIIICRNTGCVQLYCYRFRLINRYSYRHSGHLAFQLLTGYRVTICIIEDWCAGCCYI